MSPSTPDLVCSWQWLKSTCPGLLWVSHLMKTSINMGTLQRTIWLCLLDCSPPYRSAHTECTVPNQLFIHFSHCSDRTSLRSLLQGIHFRPKIIFFSPKPNTEHYRTLTLSLFYPLLWASFLCVLWEDGSAVQYSSPQAWNLTLVGAQLFLQLVTLASWLTLYTLFSSIKSGWS